MFATWHGDTRCTNNVQLSRGERYKVIAWPPNFCCSSFAWSRASCSVSRFPYCVALYTSAVFSIVKPSVRQTKQSVRQTRELWQTKAPSEKKVQLLLILFLLLSPLIELSNEPMMNSVRLPLSPKWAHVTVFRIKVHYYRRKYRRKSATKFFCAKVVRHSLAYLTVHKWLVGDVPLKVNFVPKVNHPLARERMPAMRISTKEIKYHAHLIWVATITMQYEIYNSAH